MFASGGRYCAAGGVVSAACGRGSGRVDVVVGGVGADVCFAARVGSGRREWFRPLFVGLGRDGLRSVLRADQDITRLRAGTAG